VRRILDLSGAFAKEVFRLRIDKGCVVIAHGAEEAEVRIPAHEIAVLILGHRLAVTGAVLGHVVANGGAVMALDDRFNPCGLMLPLAGNSAHPQRLRAQIERTPATSPALWQQIVRAKIVAQAENVPSILSLADSVELGDASNVEATAARAYWMVLFGDGFKRHDDTAENKLLNYGYAVLRSVVGRAVCAAGLHPAIGIHHRGSPFALADDLMEPARPAIDAVVKEMGEKPLSESGVKRRLAEAVLTSVRTGSGKTNLVEAYEQVCRSLVDVMMGERKSLLLWEAA
jgi:CRISPR-associated protein Cas1